MVLEGLVYVLVLEDRLGENVGVRFSADFSIDSQQFERYRKCTDNQDDLSTGSDPSDDVQGTSDRSKFPC